MTNDSIPPVTPQHPIKKFRNQLWVRITAAVFLFIIIAIAVMLAIQGLRGHDWSNGLAPQKSAEEIATIQSAVDSVKNDAVLDTLVRNSNTTGQPFGHSISVSILVDADKLSFRNEDDAVVYGKVVIEAIRKTGISDVYDVRIGPDVKPGAISGRGTAEEPITEARYADGSLFDESVTVK